MTNGVVRAIRFWAYPTVLIALWVVISAFSLTQLATILPLLASPVSVQATFQNRAHDRAPRGCVVCLRSTSRMETPMRSNMDWS